VMVYNKTTLDNGLRILTVPMPHTRSVGMGVFTGVGSRYESQVQQGISHFIEHMLFKGTQRRPTAQQISEAIEGLGGILNAGTGSEMTTYWAKVAHHHLPIALDVLLDLFRHSLFEPAEVEKERQVILQEIGRLMDMPDSWVHVLIGELIWPAHPVGWEIVGTKESVSGIQRQHLLDYVTLTYTPCNTVVSIAGNLDEQKVLDQLSRELANWEMRPAPACLPATDANGGPALRIEYKETEQAHLCVGLRGLSLNDPDYFKLRLLNVILGEGMSSRLFLDVRERQGLAYSVGSYTSFLSDTGAIILYAGVAPQKVSDVISAMMEQLHLLRKEEVPQSELIKAKEFLKGRILLRMEDTFANAQWFGKQEVLNQEVLTVDQVIARLDQVTAADIQTVARRLFTQEQLRLAAIGPFKNETEFRERLSL
jgi:predicted Zn-dependent peptidase